MVTEFALWDQFSLDFSKSLSESTSYYYEHHFRQAEIAESLGFAQYYTIEHQSSFIGSVSSPTVLLAALSQRTSTLRLGAMIWQLPFHNPLRLAQEIATLDQVSRGRVEFGTGLGVHEHEFLRWNIDFENRREVSEETLEIIRMAWTQDEVTFKGKFWQFDEAFTMPKPYQRPHPPIWVAAHSLRSVEFAVQQGYDMAQSINGDVEMAAKFAHYHDQWAKVWPQRPLGRKFILRSVIVAETDAKAEELGREYVQNMFPWGIERLRETRIGTGTSQYITGPDDTPENRARRQVMAECRKSYEFALESGCAVVGSPETVARRIREQNALMGGIDVYACDFQVGPMDPGMVERSMTLFGRHVIPALVKG